MEEREQSTRRVFEVWRLDENGNEFLMDTYSNRAQAEKRIAELAESGHKQTYWLKEVAP